jgi:hypothetical protein
LGSEGALSFAKMNLGSVEMGLVLDFLDLAELKEKVDQADVLEDADETDEDRGVDGRPLIDGGPVFGVDAAAGCEGHGEADEPEGGDEEPGEAEVLGLVGEGVVEVSKVDFFELGVARVMAVGHAVLGVVEGAGDDCGDEAVGEQEGADDAWVIEAGEAAEQGARRGGVVGGVEAAGAKAVEGQKGERPKAEREGVDPEGDPGASAAAGQVGEGDANEERDKKGAQEPGARAARALIQVEGAVLGAQVERW